MCDLYFTLPIGSRICAHTVPRIGSHTVPRIGSYFHEEHSWSHFVAVRLHLALLSIRTLGLLWLVLLGMAVLDGAGGDWIMGC